MITPLDFLHASWSRCWTGLGASIENHALCDRLISAYGESQRKYHTLQHLGECLTLFEAQRHHADEPHEIEVALWFHDAIYQVRAGDNEQRSADWAAGELRAGCVDAARIERVIAHVLATRHAALPVGADQALLVDIDLSILGAEPARFDEYEDQVRAEYRWVPDFMFRPKRRDILTEFLRRDPIYTTAALRDKLEGQARANLTRSLLALSR